MKIKEYKEFKWRKEELSDDYLISEYKKGVHWIKIYKKDGKFFYNSSKRCKKLIVLADYFLDLLNKGEKDLDKIERKALEEFKEEKEIEKIKDRILIIKNALRKILQ